MALLITTAILMINSAMAANSCRSEVVLAYASLGEKIAEDSFSNSTFEELNVTYTEFNLLSSSEQDEIYMQIKPLEVMVEETIGKLNRYINRYVGTYYELFMADEISQWRTHRDNLRKCE